MRVTFGKRLWVVWLVLTAMTLVYVWMDTTTAQNGTLKASTVVTVSAIGIALVKVRIVFGSSWRCATLRHCCAASPTGGWC